MAWGVAPAASAAPPLGGFPDAIVPERSAPRNAHVFAFGDPIPPLSEVGWVALVNGAALQMSPSLVGCCLLEARVAAMPGDTVDVTVVGPTGDQSIRYTVGAAADVTAPVLQSLGIIDASGGDLVLGATGSDDVELAGFLALDGADVLSATPVGRALRLRGARCADVVAFDLAGNRSETTTACAPDDEVPPEPPLPPETGCTAGGVGTATAWAVMLLLTRRKRGR